MCRLMFRRILSIADVGLVCMRASLTIPIAATQLPIHWFACWSLAGELLESDGHLFDSYYDKCYLQLHTCLHWCQDTPGDAAIQRWALALGQCLQTSSNLIPITIWPAKLLSEDFSTHNTHTHTHTHTHTYIHIYIYIYIYRPIHFYWTLCLFIRLKKVTQH